MVAAFSGWNDAADAASDAVRWLARAFGDARPFAALDIEEYLDFQAARPTVELVDGVVRTVNWPSLAFSAGSLPAGGRDLVLLLGVEPNLKWRVVLRRRHRRRPHDRLRDRRHARRRCSATRRTRARSSAPAPRPTRCSRPGSGCSGRATKARPASSACCTTRCAGRRSRRRRSGRRSRTTSPRRPNPKATRALLDRLAATARPRPRSHRPRHRVERVGTVGVRGRRGRRRRELVRRPARDALRRQPTTTGLLDDDDETTTTRTTTTTGSTRTTCPSGDSLAEDFERYLRDQRDE